MPLSSIGQTQNDFFIDSARRQNLSTTSAIMGRDASQLDMNDFFNLLVAQMTNQDMMNPQTDTDYIAQMAQFTTLRGIQVIQEYQVSSYAASYTGKTVAIAHTGDSGNLTRTEGVVTGVTFYDGEPKVIVNGISFPLYAVMEVKLPGTPNSPSTGGTGSTGGSGTVSQTDAVAYIGKTVTITYTNEYDEEIDTEGVVTEVKTNKDGVVHVIVGGNEYPASAVKSVR